VIRRTNRGRNFSLPTQSGSSFFFFFLKKQKDLFFLVVLHKEHDTISGQRLRLRVLWVRRKKFFLRFFKKKLKREGACFVLWVGKVGKQIFTDTENKQRRQTKLKLHGFFGFFGVFGCGEKICGFILFVGFEK
jgi:hypothetical protein